MRITVIDHRMFEALPRSPLLGYADNYPLLGSDTDRRTGTAKRRVRDGSLNPP
jgi:hypothetical protein